MKLAKLKVVQMRKELEARGLDFSGTRPVLMKRLREALNREEADAKGDPQAGNANTGPRNSRGETEEERMATTEYRPDGVDDPADVNEAQDRPEPHETEQRRHNDDVHHHVREHAGDRAASNSAFVRSDRRGMENGAAADGRESDRAHSGPHAGATDLQERSTEQPSYHQTREASDKNEQVGDDPKAAPMGSLSQASVASMDERMRRRRERFGGVKPDPPVSEQNAGPMEDAAVRRRRERFGVVDHKESAEKLPQRPQKRRPDRVRTVDPEAQRQHEEARKRRAAKFGIAGDAEKSQVPEQVVVPAEEIERRLKRQRRFQHVGSGC